MKSTRRHFLKKASALSAAVAIGCDASSDTTGGGETPGADAAMGTSDSATASPDITEDAGARADVMAVEDTYELPEDLPEYQYDGAPGPADLFAHGVASGDPLTDAVIILASGQILFPHEAADYQQPSVAFPWAAAMRATGTR